MYHAGAPSGKNHSQVLFINTCVINRIGFKIIIDEGMNPALVFFEHMYKINTGNISPLYEFRNKNNLTLQLNTSFNKLTKLVTHSLTIE